MQYLRPSDLAKAVGVHPNTVRRYVDWGLLPPVEHSPSGYRRFTQRHLDCLRLARQVYCNQYPGKAIHQSGIRIIQATVSSPWLKKSSKNRLLGIADLPIPPRAKPSLYTPGL